MISRRAGLAAWTSCGATAFLLAVVLVLGALTPEERLPEDLRPHPDWFVTPAYLLVLAATGAVIASRRPRNLVGWLMCAVAVLGGLVELGRAYAEYGLSNGRPAAGAADWFAWLANWIWIIWLMLQVVYLPILFPEGKLPSRRWAWLIWAASVTAAVGAVGRALDPALLGTVELSNPLGVPDPHGYASRVAAIATLVLIVLGLASLASAFIRLKSSTGDRRHQLKWFGAGITFLVTLVAAQTVYDLLFGDRLHWLEVLISIAYLTIPLSIGFSVLRYRLYDIDLVVSRTLLYGAAATFISAFYLTAVVGVGAVVGLGTGVHLLLSLLAAGVVALAFQPARERLQRLAGRVVFGRRATPYDALAVLSRRVAESAPSEPLLSEMVRAACDAVGLPSASLWLLAGGDWRPVASWPPGTSHQVPRLSSSGQPGCLSVPVHHEGRLLGAISVVVPAGRSLSPLDRRLLADLANQAGLVFRNLGLTADLMARLAELRESRRRLVTAQDSERRRLERNLHDGAQQQLLSLRMAIRELRTLRDGDAGQARSRLERLEEEADQALRTVRELARGLYPPLLRAQGLAGALSARARAAPLDVRVSTDGAGRYPDDLEAAVYFCCSEALQNAARHAEASTVRIELAQEGDELVFAVKDDGRGFDVDSPGVREGAGLQSMRDRIDVVGGTLEIASRPNRGTTVRGRVPVSAPD